MNALRDPVFKGCTRPAMLWGVPLVPVLIVGGGMLIPAIWALLASPHDDQRLKQYALRLRMRLHQPNRRFWGTHAYTPVRVKRRT
jgi:type IV secretion system protein VirB3